MQEINLADLPKRCQNQYHEFFEIIRNKNSDLKKAAKQIVGAYTLGNLMSWKDAKTKWVGLAFRQKSENNRSIWQIKFADLEFLERTLKENSIEYFRIISD